MQDGGALPVIMSIIGPRETHDYRNYNLLGSGIIKSQKKQKTGKLRDWDGSVWGGIPLRNPTPHGTWLDSGSAWAGCLPGVASYSVRHPFVSCDDHSMIISNGRGGFYIGVWPGTARDNGPAIKGLALGPVAEEEIKQAGKV